MGSKGTDGAHPCSQRLTGPPLPDCTCTFKDRCKLREHLRSHTQEKVVACPTCGGMFANNTKFLDHIRRQTALDRKLPWGVARLFCPAGVSVGMLSQGRGPHDAHRAVSASRLHRLPRCLPTLLL